ncbi:MAG TPA: acyl-CoA dehydrogenase family protein [Caulobacteraceae bacterium]|jgi:alkylation response protein AidB-like acyl-CoA dehydrogenase|nr:acyl-CoA dehydrogenase family protein [Caulobacteraceae bacterium]
MDFGIRDDDQLIVDTMSAFAAEQLRPALRTAEAAHAVSPPVRASFGELGFEDLDMPEAAGGAGLGMLTRVLANIALARADAGAAIGLDRVGPALHVLRAFGGDDAVARFARPVLDAPGARVALIIEEADRDLAAAGRISGGAAWVPTDRADLVVGLGPTGAWVLEGGARLQPVPGAGLQAAGASRIDFDGPAAAAWSDPEAAARALARVRVYHGALIVGVLEDATEFTRAYAQERVAFGQPIAHHQGLAFLIVDMFTAVEQARLLIEDAARRMEAGDDAVQEAAAAFVEAVEASRFVGPNGVQILGGHGFMRDFPVEKAMRDCRALGLLAGGLHRARDDAASLAAAFEEA